jgi:hypothetical protein
MRTATAIALTAVASIVAIVVGLDDTAGNTGVRGDAPTYSSCSTGSYPTEVLERDRTMTEQMASAQGRPMAGDPMWQHSRDQAFLDALECQVREVESMFGRTDPYGP